MMRLPAPVVLLAAVCSCTPESPRPAPPEPDVAAVLEPEPDPEPTPKPETDPEPDPGPLYPNIETLFGGEQGLYRSCGPNNGVCHNNRQYPDMRTLSGVLDLVGSPCNALRDTPESIHDWCEPHGDLLSLGDGQHIELGQIVSLGDDAFRIHLRNAPEDLGEGPLDIVREDIDGPRTLYHAIDRWMALDLIDDTIDARLSPQFERTPGDEEGVETHLRLLREALSRAGTPSNPGAIQLGDPNGNGTFGADQGRALIVPGDPEGSYLMRRLVDPEFGSLMPLANCCAWSKEALQALWCWIAGLDGLGSNALDPIDFDACPPGLPDTVVYPTLGPDCETEGPCPVQPTP